MGQSKISRIHHDETRAELMMSAKRATSIYVRWQRRSPIGNNFNATFRQAAREQPFLHALPDHNNSFVTKQGPGRGEATELRQ
jgi:hypothetical protein